MFKKLQLTALVLVLGSGTAMLLPMTDYGEGLSPITSTWAAPKTCDADGDGVPEVVTVESHIHFGARLSIWGSEGMITSNQWIGQRNRWLAPVGAADIDGDGYMEIAFVDRPHLAREMAIYKYRDRNLEFVISILPFTNHKIGEEYITGGVRQCGNRSPEFVVASGDWDDVLAIYWSGDRPAVQFLRKNEGPQSFEAALECKR